MAISMDERGFFVVLGNRIARLRKDRPLTQAQLAETLGISQPTMNAYALGQRRVPDGHGARCSFGAHHGLRAPFRRSRVIARTNRGCSVLRRSAISGQANPVAMGNGCPHSALR